MRTVRASPRARFFVVTLRSLAQTNPGSKQMLRYVGRKTVDIGQKSVFHKLQYRSTNAF